MKNIDIKKSKNIIKYITFKILIRENSIFDKTFIQQNEVFNMISKIVKKSYLDNVHVKSIEICNLSLHENNKIFDVTARVEFEKLITTIPKLDPCLVYIGQAHLYSKEAWDKSKNIKKDAKQII